MGEPYQQTISGLLRRRSELMGDAQRLREELAHIGNDIEALDRTLISLGHNLDTDGTCGLRDPSDLNGVDPLLGPLANNGGFTQTQALLAGSPAIDAGQRFSGSDQRGLPRFQGASSDAGAYEVQLRRGQEQASVGIDDAASEIRKLWETLP